MPLPTSLVTSNRQTVTSYVLNLLLDRCVLRLCQVN